MNGPTKAVGPPWTPLPARKSKGVLEKVLDDADAVTDGNWPAAHNMCFWAVKAPNIGAVDSGTRGPICSFLQSTF